MKFNKLKVLVMIGVLGSQLITKSGLTQIVKKNENETIGSCQIKGEFNSEVETEIKEECSSDVISTEENNQESQVSYKRFDEGTERSISKIPSLIDIYGNKIEDVQKILDVFSPPNIIQRLNGGSTLNPDPEKGQQGEIQREDKVLQLTDAAVRPAKGTSTSIWAKTKVDLSKKFTYESYIYLGDRNNGEIADGITFTLHNDKDGKNATDIGKKGGQYASNGNAEGAYLGVNGPKVSGIAAQQSPKNRRVKNSLSFEFDTHLNPRVSGDFGAVDNDVHNVRGSNGSNFNKKGSHMGFVKGYANEPNDLIPHESLAFSKVDLGDGKWHKFQISWNPTGTNSGSLTAETDMQVVYRDQSESENPMETDHSLVSYQSMDIADINAVFGFKMGEPKEVWWGYTGSTGDMSASSAIAVTKLPDDPNVNEKLAIKKREANDKEYSEKIKVSKGNKLTLKSNNLVENSKTNDTKVKHWQNVTTSLRLPKGIILDRESSKARIYNYRIGSTKKELMDEVDVSLVEQEGIELVKIKVDGSVNGNDGYEDNQEIELDLIVEDMKNLEEDKKSMITGLAEGENGVTKSEKPVCLEVLDRQPITVNYVYNNGLDDKLLPKEMVESKIYEPKDEQLSVLVPTDMLDKHFNYIENNLGLEEINEKGELVIPFNENRQVVNLRYDGMTWFASLEGGLSFKGKMQAGAQVLDRVTDQIYIEVESTVLEPNWQLKAKLTDFTGETQVPDKGLELRVANQFIGKEMTTLISGTAKAKEFVIGVKDNNSARNNLQADLIVAPNSYMWTKKELIYDTTITWFLIDNQVGQTYKNQNVFPLKEVLEYEK